MNLKRGIDREWARKAPAAGAPVSVPANGNGHGDAATTQANGAAAKRMSVRECATLALPRRGSG